MSEVSTACPACGGSGKVEKGWIFKRYEACDACLGGFRKNRFILYAGGPAPKGMTPPRATAPSTGGSSGSDVVDLPTAAYVAIDGGCIASLSSDGGSSAADCSL